MALTLLDTVKTYLNAIDGFMIDSITETDEAYRAARIARDVYLRLFSDVSNFKPHGRVLPLESLADLSKPTHLLIPESVQRIQDSVLEYNLDDERTSYYQLTYLQPLEFLRLIRNRTGTDTGAVVVTEDTGSEYVVYNNRQPQHWTSFDDQHIVMDSWNLEESDTVVASRTRMYATVIPTFVLEDDFVVPIPVHLEYTYLDNFVDEAALLMRNEPLPRVAQRARASRIKLQQDHRRSGSQGSSKPKYGRR